MKKSQFIEDLEGHGFELCESTNLDRGGATLRTPPRRGLPGALRVLITWAPGPKLDGVSVYVYAGPKGREVSTWSVEIRHCPPVEVLAKIIDACLP